MLLWYNTDQKQSSGERIDSSSQFPITAHPRKEVEAAATLTSCHSTPVNSREGMDAHLLAQLLSVPYPLTQARSPSLLPSVGWAFPHLSTYNLSTPSDMPMCQLHLHNLSLRLSWVTLDCVRMRVNTNHHSTMSSVSQAPARWIFSSSFPCPKFDHQVLLWESCSSSYSSPLAFSPSAPTVVPFLAPGSFLSTPASAIQGCPAH